MKITPDIFSSKGIGWIRPYAKAWFAINPLGDRKIEDINLRIWRMGFEKFTETFTNSYHLKRKLAEIFG